VETANHEVKQDAKRPDIDLKGFRFQVSDTGQEIEVQDCQVED